MYLLHLSDSVCEVREVIWSAQICVQMHMATGNHHVFRVIFVSTLLRPLY